MITGFAFLEKNGHIQRDEKLYIIGGNFSLITEEHALSCWTWSQRLGINNPTKMLRNYPMKQVICHFIHEEKLLNFKLSVMHDILEKLCAMVWSR